MPEYERITCEDVRVGDLIARTRTEVFQQVTYDVGHLRERIDELSEQGARTWAAALEGDLREALDLGAQPTDIAKDAGNIRPRRTAKLWREVVAEPEESPGAKLVRELAEEVGYDEDGGTGVGSLIAYKNALEDELVRRLS